MNDLGVDFLDLHYYLRMQQFRRAYDGIHWDCTAHRRISNLLLHHFCECWNLTTPGRFVVSARDTVNVSNSVEEKNNEKAVKDVEDDDEIEVNKLVEGNKGKRDEEKVNKTPKKISEDDYFQNLNYKLFNYLFSTFLKIIF